MDKEICGSCKETRIKAIELRKTGLTYRAIGKALNIHPNYPSKIKSLILSKDL